MNEHRLVVALLLRRSVCVVCMICISALCAIGMYYVSSKDAFGFPIGYTSYLFRIVILMTATLGYVVSNLKQEQGGLVILLPALIFAVLWMLLVELVSMGIHLAS